MDKIVADLLRKTAHGNRLDESKFIIEQSRLPPERRNIIRHDPTIVSQYFGIKVPEAAPSDYFYWDNTTLCLKFPLLEIVKSGDSVLEIGPGPAATLSLFVRKQKTNIHSTCAEINLDFVRSAEKIVELNDETVKLIHSDMTANIDGLFDVVFMNPPYVPPAGLKELDVDKRSHEWKAGFGGEDGSDVVGRFLQEVPRVLKKTGTAILGVNTRHLEDAIVTRHVNQSLLKLKRRFFSDDVVPPHGPYSQAYILSY